MNKTIRVGFLLAFLGILITTVNAQVSPREFLGYSVGADGKLAGYDQILEYFRRLEKETDRMRLFTIGRTVQGRPLVMAAISTPENLAAAQEYQTISRRLRDARDLSDKEARRLAARGRTIILITCSLHATEIGASQMSMELAWKLVTGDTPFSADRVLSKVILLLVPTSNPDGVQMVTDWYRRYRGTEYEGGRMPWLYHPYAGHDNNRDWFMGNLPETRALMNVLYSRWIPQIHLDEHQMGSSGARLFLPPFKDPPTEPVHPLVWRGVALCGTHMAYRLQEKNRAGVVHGRSFTGWWIGACDDTSWLHNCVGILSETASVKVASPVYVDPGEIPQEYVVRSMQFPQPWKGGWWRLRDIVDYELNLSMALIEAGAVYRDSFLFNFYRMCRDALEPSDSGGPTAFLVPCTQHDPSAARRMLRILQRGGVEIHQATREFTVGRRVWPSGTWVVRMDQPYRPYAQALLERQRYPDIRQYPGGPPVPPYDNAGWTLPLQMGVECVPVYKPLPTELERVGEITAPPVEFPAAGKGLWLDGRENATYSAVFRMLEKGGTVYRRVQAPAGNDNGESRSGDFLVRPDVRERSRLQSLQKELGFQVREAGTTLPGGMVTLRYPRIGVYQSWLANMDEGWTRYMLDDAGIRYRSLHNKDIQMSGGRKGLNGRYDVILIPAEDRHLIVSGEPAPDSRWRRYFTPLPPQYRGGIGRKGVAALKAFVKQGGHLVVLGRASELILAEFSPPARNVLKGLKSREFFCPMSILQVEVDDRHPLGLGMPSRASVVFDDSPAFATWIPRGIWGREVVVRYPREHVLESGWLLGESHLARRAALVDLKYGAGRIVMVGFRPQNRAQSHGTYKLLFNAFLRSAWKRGD